eukprot:3356013-Ditylum_brightwellii.AAC.1
MVMMAVKKTHQCAANNCSTLPPKFGDVGEGDVMVMLSCSISKESERKLEDAVVNSGQAALLSGFGITCCAL